MKYLSLPTLLFGSLLLSLSCSSVYYKFWETLGREKRDLLKTNVAAASESQEDLEEEFKDTISKIRSEYKFDGGSLEETYDSLSEDLADAESEAASLTSRIDKVEDVGEDLFAEWQSEINELTNPKYKSDSKKKRASTERKFNTMLASMRRVEASMEPILRKFRDQVLYLKHNLNAAALGAFKTEFVSIESDINGLIKRIEASSSEAESFIKDIE